MGQMKSFKFNDTKNGKNANLLAVICELYERKNFVVATVIYTESICMKLALLKVLNYGSQLPHSFIVTLFSSQSANLFVNILNFFHFFLLF